MQIREQLEQVVEAAISAAMSDGSLALEQAPAAALERQGRSIHAALADNDAYPALRSVGGLIMTGPTGTNVNYVAVVLIRGRKGENA